MTVVFPDTVCREPERSPHVPEDRMRSVLVALDDLELLAMVGSLARGASDVMRHVRCS